MFQVVLTGYRIGNVNTITMKDTPCMISSIGGTAREIIGTCNTIFANVTFITTIDRITFNNFLVGVQRWCLKLL